MNLKKTFSQNTWLKVGLSAGLIHLALVFYGAAGFQFSTDNALEKIANLYSELSGSGFEYDFFAPGVTSQIRATFDVVDAQSHHFSMHLNDGTNREVDLRIGDIIETFLGDDDTSDQTGDEPGDATDDERAEEQVAEREADQLKLQRDLAASLSASVFARYPQAKSVNLKIDRFTPISMEDYRKGLRPVWVPLYSAEFINKHNVVRR